jgi:uncharacterized protein YceH (UPF0502 family)
MPEILLNAEEARVLGVLVEKQITTPEYYPMSLHALNAGCNQKNNRDPVTAYDERTVVRALDLLREKRLATMISEAGARVPKYRHVMPELFGLDGVDTALLCELLLRGPQTPGELRSRAARMAEVAAPGLVEAALEGLITVKQLVVKLPRQPGHKECRYQHTLCGRPDPAATAEPTAPVEPARAALAADQERIAKLEAETAALRGDLESLRAQFAEFRRQFE